MYPLHEENKSSLSAKKIIVGIVFIALTIGTSLASTLTINSNNRVTFGQGVYQIRACDGWIKISFEKTSTDNGVLENGVLVQAVSAINIDNFNSLACKNTNFKITLYKASAPTTALDLYSQEDSTASNQVWLSVDNSGVVSLVDTYGVNLTQYGDTAVGLGLDSDTGRYTIYFFTPLQPASNVDSYTVESGPNAGGNWTSCSSGLANVDANYVTIDSSVSGKCILTFKLGQTFTIPVGVSAIDEALVVGGGGGGGFNSNGGGGGAGQVQHRNSALALGSATKLVITIGDGGTDGWITTTNWTAGQNGGATEIRDQSNNLIIRAGGGGGGCGATLYRTGYEGSSGGGCTGVTAQAASTANATAGWTKYANAGKSDTAGGGGGAGAAATSSVGGNGVTLFGLAVGGGGGGWSGGAAGGSGGGGTAISGSSYQYAGGDRVNGSNGSPNTGGGGGAARDGGSGVVKISYTIP